MITRRSATALLFGLPAMALTASRVRAEPLPAPSGNPILSVTGKITKTNEAASAVFDRPMLEALEQATIRTVTPWFDGVMTFEGVPMTRLMEATGADGTTLIVHALNDYTSEIPIEDFAKYNPILAIKRNGQYMAVRDKGPLFIIYPYDSSPELNKQKFYSRSAWQIARMQVA